MLFRHAEIAKPHVAIKQFNRMIRAINNRLLYAMYREPIRVYKDDSTHINDNKYTHRRILFKMALMLESLVLHSIYTTNALLTFVCNSVLFNKRTHYININGTYIGHIAPWHIDIEPTMLRSNGIIRILRARKRIDAMYKRVTYKRYKY